MPAAACGRRSGAGFAGPLLAVVVVAVGMAAVAGVRLPAHPGFVLVMLSLVGCCDVLSVVLLVGQFRDTNDARVLALSWAYVSSLVILFGWAAAFPGVFPAVGPLGRVSSTASWLWVAWHTAFPLLLGAALLPWPATVARVLPPARRRWLAWGGVTAAAVAGGAVVAVVVGLAGRLPVIIHGTDSSAMTRIAGPVMLPVVLAALATSAGARRRSGPERWAGLAATAAVGDVVLTLTSHYRFSVGWYAGRTMTILSAGVVLTAMIVEFRRTRRELVEDGRQLRRLLEATDRLERLQATLLGHMSEGVLLQDATGRVLTSNPAACALLGLSADQLRGRLPMDPRWGGATCAAAGCLVRRRRRGRTRTGFRACRDRAALGRLDDLPAGTYLSINASPATVTSPQLRRLLANVPPGRLVLELTEHVEVTDYAALAGSLNHLRWAGVRLAVDDAGAGYASLQHILNLAPDLIKLDATLVRDIGTDPARSSLAASLKTFADRLGAQIVAGGIETAREHAALLELGIRYGQGYFLGRPAAQLPEIGYPRAPSAAAGLRSRR